MKNTLILLSLSLLVSCGKRIKDVKYIENPYDNSSNDARLAELSQRVGMLESKADAAISSIQNLDTVQAAQAANLTALKLELEQADEDSRVALQNAINAAQASFNTINASIVSLQSDVYAALTELGEIKSHDSIVEFVDPCGDGNGYDEILLKTSSGKVIAYFEQGNNRHLSLLEADTLYSTTDAQRCQFKIDTEGNLL
jgi:hypothetical protein